MKISITCLCLVVSLTSTSLGAPFPFSQYNRQSIEKLRTLFESRTGVSRDAHLIHNHLDPSDDGNYHRGDEDDDGRILSLLPYVSESGSPAEIAHLADLSSSERAHFGPADYGQVTAPSAQIQEYQLHRLRRLRHCQQAMADGGDTRRHYGDLVVVTLVMLFLVAVLMVELLEKLYTRVRNHFHPHHGVIQLPVEEKDLYPRPLSPPVGVNII